MCTCACECRCLQSPEEGAGSPTAGIMGAGNWALVLLTTEPQFYCILKALCGFRVWAAIGTVFCCHLSLPSLYWFPSCSPLWLRILAPIASLGEWLSIGVLSKKLRRGSWFGMDWSCGWACSGMVGEVLARCSLSEAENVVRRGGSWNDTEDSKGAGMSMGSKTRDIQF